MSGRDFKISTTANGEWGPDGIAGNGDDGTEYTTGKTTNGTAGSGGAYVQYDWTAGSNLTVMYFYDGGTGTAANNVYGGAGGSGIVILKYSDAFTITGVGVTFGNTYTSGGYKVTPITQGTGTVSFS